MIKLEAEQWELLSKVPDAGGTAPYALALDLRWGMDGPRRAYRLLRRMENVGLVENVGGGNAPRYRRTALGRTLLGRLQPQRRGHRRKADGASSRCPIPAPRPPLSSGPDVEGHVPEKIKDRVFRTRAKLLGGHYHVRVFSADRPDHTWAKLGDLVMDPSDYASFTQRFKGEHLPEEEQG